jgi:hypothetical protein
MIQEFHGTAPDLAGLPSKNASDRIKKGSTSESEIE